MKGKCRPPAPPSWPGGAPVSSLSPSSPCPQGMGNKQVKKQPALLCSVLLGGLSIQLAWVTGEQGRCPALTWQWAGGPSPSSCPLPHWVAPMTKPALHSSLGPSPLLTIDHFVPASLENSTGSCGQPQDSEKGSCLKYSIPNTCLKIGTVLDE